MSVEDYRMKRRADKAGHTLAEEQDMRAMNMLPVVRQNAVAAGILPSEWLQAAADRDRLWKRTSDFLAAAADRRGMSLAELVNRLDERSTGGAALAVLGQASLHDDPPTLIVPADAMGGTREHILSSSTGAGVESAGGIAATRGRNLAEKGVATLAVGPLGAFLFGNATEQIHDGRELYLLVDDPDWSLTLPVHPNLGQQTRAFSQAINRLAKSISSDTSPEMPDAVAQLERLARMYDTGVLSDDEFAAAKRRILGS